MTKYIQDFVSEYCRLPHAPFSVHDLSRLNSTIKHFTALDASRFEGKQSTAASSQPQTATLETSVNGDYLRARLQFLGSQKEDQ